MTLSLRPPAASYSPWPAFGPGGRVCRMFYFSLRNGFPIRARTHFSETTRGNATNNCNRYQNALYRYRKAASLGRRGRHPHVLLQWGSSSSSASCAHEKPRHSAPHARSFRAACIAVAPTGLDQCRWTWRQEPDGSLIENENSERKLIAHSSPPPGPQIIITLQMRYNVSPCHQISVVLRITVSTNHRRI